MKYIVLILLSIFIFSKGTQGQNIELARTYIDTLTAPSYHGRGYVQNGDQKAADYITQQMQKYDLQSFQNTYQQPYTIKVNTFPDSQKVIIGDTSLQPGRDFLVAPYSSELEGTYPIAWLSSKTVNPSPTDTIYWPALPYFLFIDTPDVNAKKLTPFINEHPISSRRVAEVRKKIGAWHISDTVLPVTHLTIKRSAIPQKADSIKVNIDQRYRDQYTTQNVVGYIEGKTHPDSFLVFTAHYDHLGRLGANTYFPGANDNASGTALLLDLARYYSLPQHQPDYSIAFIAFGGEEAGLLGSKYYVNHPLFPLTQIKLLINVDLVGTGQKGGTVVNGKKHRQLFKRLKSINKKQELLPELTPRGTARNSDHYPFSQKNVPSFFIYLRGSPGHYHDIYDQSSTLPLATYEELFSLLTRFSDQLQKAP